MIEEGDTGLPSRTTVDGFTTADELIGCIAKDCLGELKPNAPVLIVTNFIQKELKVSRLPDNEYERRIMPDWYLGIMGDRMPLVRFEDGSPTLRIEFVRYIRGSWQSPREPKAGPVLISYFDFIETPLKRRFQDPRGYAGTYAAFDCCVGVAGIESAVLDSQRSPLEGSEVDYLLAARSLGIPVVGKPMREALDRLHAYAIKLLLDQQKDCMSLARRLGLDTLETPIAVDGIRYNPRMLYEDVQKIESSRGK